MKSKASVEELRARVEAARKDLHDSIETVTLVVEEALDWKRAVRAHPIQAAAIGLTLGFLLIRSGGALPALLKQAGTMGLSSLAGAGGSSVVNGLLRQFLPGRRDS